MPETSFNRLEMAARGSEIKQNVFDALLLAQEIKFKPEAHAQFILTALKVYSCVVRAQLLEVALEYAKQDKLTEVSVDLTVKHLCQELDLEAEKLGQQVLLINEVKNAPPARH
jgi:hypothetical protein